MKSKMILFVLVLLLLCLESPLLSKLPIESQEGIEDLKRENNDLKNRFNEISEEISLEKKENSITYAYLLREDAYTQNTVGIITKGVSDGVETNAVITSKNRFLGIVKKVEENRAEVYFLRHANIQVSVKVGNAYGILECVDGNLLVHSISNYEEIHEGDEVYTSGLTNIPGGIYVGKIKDIYKTNAFIEQVASLTDTIDPNTVRFVSVIKENF